MQGVFAGDPFPYSPPLKTAQQMLRDGKDRFFINPRDITAGFTFTRISSSGTVVTLTESGNKFQKSGDGRRLSLGLPKPLMEMSTEEMVEASAVESWDASDKSPTSA